MKNILIIISIAFINIESYSQINFFELFEHNFDHNSIGKQIYYTNNPESFKDTSFQSLKIDLEELAQLDEESIEHLRKNKNLVFLEIYNYKSFSDTTKQKLPAIGLLKNIKVLVFKGNTRNFDSNLFSEINKIDSLQYLVFTSLSKNIDKYSDHDKVLKKLKGYKVSFGDYILPDDNNIVSFISNQNDISLKSNLRKLKKNSLKQLSISIDTLDDSFCNLISNFKNLQYFSFEYKVLKSSISFSDVIKKLKRIEVFHMRNCISEDLEYLQVLKKLKELEISIKRNININLDPVFNIKSLQYLQLSLDTLKTFQISKVNSPELKRINIYGNLKAIPPELCQIKSLQELTANYNKIEFLPQEIGNLINLETLNLNQNQLEELPEEFCNLFNLKEVSLSENYLKELPAQIGNLKNLKKFDAYFNEIQFIPPSIGDCRNLEVLNLNCNFLKELPEEITNLSELKELSLNSNKLTILPKNLGNLTSLEYFDVGRGGCSLFDRKSTRTERTKNDISEIPISIINLKKLKRLDFSQNEKLGDKSLELLMKTNSKNFDLNLDNCSISNLPSGGWENFYVIQLDLYKNKIKSLPKEIFNSNISKLQLRANELGKLNTYIENRTNLKIVGYQAGYVTKEELMQQQNLLDVIIEICNRYYHDQSDNPILELYPIAEDIDSIKAYNLIKHFKYANALYNAKRYKECIPHYKSAIDDNLQGCMTILNDLLEGLQKMSKAYLNTSDTLNCIKNLELMQNKYKLNFDSEIGMLYKMINNKDKSEIYFQKEENRLKKVKTDNDYEVIGNQLNLLEFYLITENYNRFDSLSQIVKIEKDEEYLLGYYYIFDYLKILRKHASVNFESLAYKFTNELKNSKYSNVEWSCRLIEYWSKLQTENVRPIINDLNNLICPEGY